MLNLRRQLVLLNKQNIYWKPVYSYISRKLFCSFFKKMKKKLNTSIWMICSTKCKISNQELLHNSFPVDFKHIFTSILIYIKISYNLIYNMPILVDIDFRPLLRDIQTGGGRNMPQGDLKKGSIKNFPLVLCYFTTFEYMPLFSLEIFFHNPSQINIFICG